MVAVTGFESLDALVDATVPKAIRRPDLMDLGAYTEGMRESEFLTKFKCAPAPPQTSAYVFWVVSGMLERSGTVVACACCHVTCTRKRCFC